MNTQEIKDTIKDLKDGLNSKFTPEQFKPRMEAKIKELESQLSSEPSKKSYTEKLADIDEKVKNATEKEKRATYVEVFGEEFDAQKRKQMPLPLDVAYKVALNTLAQRKRPSSNSPAPSENKREQDAKMLAKLVKPKETPEKAPMQVVKKSVPVSKASTKYAEDEDGYCDKVIAQAKERRAKAKARSLEPKKAEVTKNKEKIDKVIDNVKERAENDSISTSELKKLIAETEQLLNLLKSRLSKMK